MFEKGQIIKTKSGLVGTFHYIGGPDKNVIVLIVDGRIVCLGFDDIAEEMEPKQFDADYYVV